LDTPAGWRAIRRLEHIHFGIGERARSALLWFIVACIARIRRLVQADAHNLIDLVEGYADGRTDQLTLVEVCRTFRAAHYTPNIVRSQGGDTDIDIGEFDSPGNEAVDFAGHLAVGDLIYPDDARFESTRELFWIAGGMAEACRHAIQATIPDVPWELEELPSDLEPYREEILGLTGPRRRQFRKSPELTNPVYLGWVAMGDARRRRDRQRTAIWDAEELYQCNVAREVFPPPFLPSFSPAWRSPEVIELASAIHAERVFDRMPTLADALQNAGCMNGPLFEHCRESGSHLRGCWAIGLVLGQE
jgi:hypothetical protein